MFERDVESCVRKVPSSQSGETERPGGLDKRPDPRRSGLLTEYGGVHVQVQVQAQASTLPTGRACRSTLPTPTLHPAGELRHLPVPGSLSLSFFLSLLTMSISEKVHPSFTGRIAGPTRTHNKPAGSGSAVQGGQLHVRLQLQGMAGSKQGSILLLLLLDELTLSHSVGTSRNTKWNHQRPLTARWTALSPDIPEEAPNYCWGALLQWQVTPSRFSFPAENGQWMVLRDALRRVSVHFIHLLCIPPRCPPSLQLIESLMAGYPDSPIFSLLSFPRPCTEHAYSPSFCPPQGDMRAYDSRCRSGLLTD